MATRMFIYLSNHYQLSLQPLQNCLFAQIIQVVISFGNHINIYRRQISSHLEAAQAKHKTIKRSLIVTLRSTTPIETTLQDTRRNYQVFTIVAEQCLFLSSLAPVPDTVFT